MDANLIKIPGVATSDITLPTTGKYGSTIKWTSSNSSVISDSGKVTPASQTVYVTLTAVIKKGNELDFEKYKELASKRAADFLFKLCQID